MTSLPMVASVDYKFSAQSPGGSLSVGSNSITLSPVPLGINGADSNHWLYISGGSGTAEPVLITGGTAVSRSSSGTVIVACIYTHSGAWTVQSVLSGVQEINNAQKAEAVSRIRRRLGTLDGQVIGVLGLTFKENVADIRNSKVPDILAELRRAGIVHTHRGPGGGSSLARPAETITVGEILLAIDGPLAAMHHV